MSTKSNNFWFAFWVSLIVLFLIAIIIVPAFLVDNDEWTKAPGGCYLHTYANNHMFAPDTGTVIMYCPVTK